MRIWVRRVAKCLYPVGTEFTEEFDKLPRGVNLKAEISQPRSLEHHRLYWVLCTRVAQGIGEDAEFVDWALKVETGHCQVFVTTRGTEVLRTKSISFDKMDQIAFRAFFEACVAVIYTKWKIDPASVADILLPRGMA